MAQNPDVFRLNATRLLDLLRERELKQYWVAEQIDVDKRTMSRWTSSRIKWIKKDNIEALAKVLDCSTDELIVSVDDEAFATAAEHADAAQAISSQNLVFQLTASGKYQLAETLIKSSLQPNLPLRVLADLYLQLCETMWMQNKLEQGFLYSQKAQEIAERSNSPDLATQIALQVGIMLSKLGRYSESVEMFDDALANPVLETHKGPKAPMLLNQSVNYQDLGDYEKSVWYLQQAHEAYLKTPYPKWLQACLKANELSLMIFQNKNEEAWDFMLQTEAFTIEAEYHTGLAFQLMLRAVLEARRGDMGSAVENFEKGFAKMEFGDPGLYEALGAEIYRLAGNKARVEELVNQGLKSESSVYRAMNLEQLALLQRNAGNMDAGLATMQEIKQLMIDPLLEKRWQMFSASFAGKER